MIKSAPLKLGSFNPLTNSFADGVSAPTRIPTLDRAAVWVQYTRPTGNTSARPILAIEVHHDAKSTAPAPEDPGWSRVPVLNGGSYASGEVSADALAVAFTAVDTDAPITQHYPGVDVSGAWWLRVLVRDEVVSGGAAVVWLTGGSS